MRLYSPGMNLVDHYYHDPTYHPGWWPDLALVHAVHMGGEIKEARL